MEVEWGMATDSSILAWRIPTDKAAWRLWSMGSQRIRHDWVTKNSTAHIWMCELDHKEGRMQKNWCFQLWRWKRCLRVPWTSRRSKQSIHWDIHWKDWCWSWSSNTWPPDSKTWLIRKDPDAGKDWRQEEKVTIEDEMIGWHYWLNGYEFEWTPGVGDGQEGLVCHSPWGHKESDMT